MKIDTLIPIMAPVMAFLRAKTPTAWLNEAKNQWPILLLDHAHCEQKAALSAMQLIKRYPGELDLVQKMSRLAREELRHFEQVLALMKRTGTEFKNIAASRYAKSLRAQVRQQEPARLVDNLIIGALIEARSCERFYALLPQLQAPIQSFYAKLIQSEARHYQDYITLAKAVAPAMHIEARVAELAEVEAALIIDADTQFRFHSGSPIGCLKNKHLSQR